MLHLPQSYEPKQERVLKLTEDTPTLITTGRRLERIEPGEWSRRTEANSLRIGWKQAVEEIKSWMRQSRYATDTNQRSKIELNLI